MEKISVAEKMKQICFLTFLSALQIQKKVAEKIAQQKISFADFKLLHNFSLINFDENECQIIINISFLQIKTFFEEIENGEKNDPEILKEFLNKIKNYQKKIYFLKNKKEFLENFSKFFDAEIWKKIREQILKIEKNSENFSADKIEIFFEKNDEKNFLIIEFPATENFSRIENLIKKPIDENNLIFLKKEEKDGKIILKFGPREIKIPKKKGSPLWAQSGASGSGFVQIWQK